MSEVRLTEDTEDKSDPDYWMHPDRAIQPPQAPPMHSKLSCPNCKTGAAYSDGAGSYHCYSCHKST